MQSCIRFNDACELQELLAKHQLTCSCISAGHLVIVGVKVPAQTQAKDFVSRLSEQSGPLSDSVHRSISSCVRRYPDGSLKIDLHFGTREEASSFMEIARRGMCVSGDS
jgi:hypothetical protein